ncbi:uncharacterized protein LOC122032206 [Zingiber officinale]|uniref:Uncharacterized protein n=1 Tax=Zingiber officinale TaxID=94328 RepID=A0A8J5C8J8_ZINOF|nr:uncharacterized protein LOC122032206 [Zingiber officinale]KAG6469677.1 hypothetical protein ZIOFF_070607 [Zingiber officinale]
MAVVITEELKAKSEVYYGDEICREKSKFLLQEVNLPRGLLPLRDIIECGYDKETGFVWLKQEQKIEHVFTKIGRKVTYAPEITAYVEKNKIKKVVGVKTKELLLWLTVEEISVTDKAPENVTFTTSAGLFKTYKRSAFELEEEEKKKMNIEDEIEKIKLSPLAPAPAPEQASEVVANK